MSQFDKFLQSPRFLQPVETSTGEWSRFLKRNLALEQPSNRATPKEVADNARDSEELKREFGAPLGWAGVATGGLTLITGGGLLPAAGYAAYGLLLRATVNASSNVTERQLNDPDTHLKGVNTMGSWLAKSYVDTLKELPKELKPTVNQFKREADYSIRNMKEAMSTLAPKLPGRK